MLEAQTGSAHSLSGRLESIHYSILEKIPSLDRIAVALYDSKTDLLKTFINSTLTREPLQAYEYKLADSAALKDLAESGKSRLINNIHTELQDDSAHTQWLRSQDYKSSFTIPMLSGERLLGFIFFDSLLESAFTPAKQRNLSLYSNLITMTISAEIFAVNSLLATATAARDFTQLRDFETGMHLDRIAKISRIIAKQMAEKHHFSDDFIEYLYLFSPLHDIGKIGIPDAILLKPSRLDEPERAIMETHVEKGVDILHRVLNGYDIAGLDDSKIMVNIVAHHHEFLDGSGYPQGLAGEQIPMEARIVTVADIFDALTSVRPYKEPWSFDEAMEELQRMASRGKLDQDCVQALAECEEEVMAIVNLLQDE